MMEAVPVTRTALRITTSMKHTSTAQRFLNIQSATYNTFYHQRHLNRRPFFKDLRTASFEAWKNASAAA
jgi:hypothetical protein